MALELILRNARIAGQAADAPCMDVGVERGRIAAIEARIDAEAECLDAGGRLLSPGLVETLLDLDLTTFSVAPAQVGRVKLAIGQVD